jgi:hypothetical protein
MDQLLVYFIVVGIFFVLLCFVVFFYVYILETLEFIKYNNFPELDLPNGFECSLNFFRTMWDLRDMKMWVEKYKQFKSDYEKEKYGSTEYFDNRFYFVSHPIYLNSYVFDGFNKKTEISKKSRTAKIAIPFETIKKEVDDYYTAKKKDYNCINFSMEIMKKIQNEMIENCELNPIIYMDDHDFKNVLRYKDNCVTIHNQFSIMPKFSLKKKYESGDQDIEDEDKKAIRNYFMEMEKKNMKYIYLVEFIKEIQNDMIKKNILDSTLKMGDKQILDVIRFFPLLFLRPGTSQLVSGLPLIAEKLRNENLQHQLNKNGYKIIYDFFITKQNDYLKMKKDNEVNNLIFQTSSHLHNSSNSDSDKTEKIPVSNFSYSSDSGSDSNSEHC